MKLWHKVTGGFIYGERICLFQTVCANAVDLFGA